MNFYTHTPQLSLFLPNIRSGFNVGSFFRTADGLGIDHIFLSGFTPYPPHKEIAKTALGAENTVSWSYHLDAGETIVELKRKGIQIMALEITDTAVDLRECTPDSPTCLIVGNEVEGVPAEILQQVDITAYIPMQGKKKSFNVSIAGGIALWELRKKI